MGQSCAHCCHSILAICNKRDDEQPLISKDNHNRFSFEAQQLSQAVSTGDFEAVQMLLSETTTLAINEKDGTGCTALYKAVVNNHAGITNLLLQLGASPNEPTADGSTPLHAAAKIGSVQICALLVDHEANINAFNAQNLTPLHIAVQENHILVVKKLVELGADIQMHVSLAHLMPPSTPGAATAGAGSMNSAVANNSMSQSYETKSHASTSSSFLSVKTRSLRAIRHSRTNSMTASNSNQQHPSLTLTSSPLVLACSLGYTDIVQFLIQHGANPLDDHSDPNGSSVLMICCENGHYTTVQFLLKYFSVLQEELQDSNILTSQLKQQSSFHSWTPLHYAASAGFAEICALLVEFGANIDAIDDIERTPLHHASAKGHPDVVKLLIQFGANVDLRDDYNNYKQDAQTMSEKQGKTAYDLASESIHYHRVTRAFREALSARASSASTSVSRTANSSPYKTKQGTQSQQSTVPSTPSESMMFKYSPQAGSHVRIASGGVSVMPSSSTTTSSHARNQLLKQAMKV